MISIVSLTKDKKIYWNDFVLEHHQGVGLVDKTGKRMKGLTVFSESIRYIKQAALNSINQARAVTIDESSIQWVLTVPAIWDESAKQFMRQAADKVSTVVIQIISDNLVM